jgi:hypothetical protein
VKVVIRFHLVPESKVKGLLTLRLHAIMSDTVWTGYSSRYSDSLPAGRSGVRMPVGARFSAPFQRVPEAHPASCIIGTGLFPGGKAAGTWR